MPEDTHDTQLDDLRVALVGYGLGGKGHHTPVIVATPGLKLTTIVTSDPGRRGQAEADHEGIRVVPSFDDVVASASDHDLVVVTTPNTSHVPLAKAALAAGLPVVVDKPLTADAGEARELIAAAQAAGLMLTVYQNRRLDSDTLTVQRLLADGTLGQVSRFESRLVSIRLPVGAEGYREDPAEGGGALLDLGAHMIDQAITLFGPPTHVYAEVDHRRPGTAVDDDVFISLTHADGVRAHLWGTFVARELGPRVKVVGSRATYEKWDPDPQSSQGMSGLTALDPAWGIVPEAEWGSLHDDDGSRRIEPERGSWVEFYSGVVRSVREGAPPPVDAEDSLRVIEIFDAALESSRTGSTIAL